MPEMWRALSSVASVDVLSNTLRLFSYLEAGREATLKRPAVHWFSVAPRLKAGAKRSSPKAS